MGRLMYCCNKRRFARADLHFTFYFMLGGRGSRGHSEEVQLAAPQAGQVIWTLLDGTEVPETVEKKVMGVTVSFVLGVLHHS